MLRCAELGLSMEDLEGLTVGMVNDMMTEKANDSYDWPELASHEDFDKF